ncbi:MAG: hypothetical protein JSU05_06505 [Bacteroidetes bacterium]|nr:hypothetical protein [Bacteroidota bacterium]
MRLNPVIFRYILRRKMATIGLLTAFTVAAFATLGDDGNKGIKDKGKHLLSGLETTSTNFNKFSLKSGYVFRGSQVLNQNNSYISLNTVYTYTKGNTTYIMPVKSKIMLKNTQTGGVVINFNK